MNRVRLSATALKFILAIWITVAFLIFCAISTPTVFAVEKDTPGTGRESHLRANKLKDFFAPNMRNDDSVVVLPNAPRAEDFTEFEVGGTGAASFYADVSSISFSDGVVMLALASKSSSGVWTLTYEGYQCESLTYKIYGTTFGFDKSWEKNPRSKWKFLKGSNVGGMRFDLARYYLCNVDPVNRVEEISSLLSEGRLRIKTDRPSRM